MHTFSKLRNPKPYKIAFLSVQKIVFLTTIMFCDLQNSKTETITKFPRTEDVFDYCLDFCPSNEEVPGVISMTNETTFFMVGKSSSEFHCPLSTGKRRSRCCFWLNFPRLSWAIPLEISAQTLFCKTRLFYACVTFELVITISFMQKTTKLTYFFPKFLAKK